MGGWGSIQARIQATRNKLTRPRVEVIPREVLKVLYSHHCIIILPILVRLCSSPLPKKLVIQRYAVQEAVSLIKKIRQHLNWIFYFLTPLSAFHHRQHHPMGIEEGKERSGKENTKQGVFIELYIFHLKGLSFSLRLCPFDFFSVKMSSSL